VIQHTQVPVQKELDACKEKLIWGQKVLELVCKELVLIHEEVQVLVQVELEACEVKLIWEQELAWE
jgi:hypothetical protein